VNKPKIEFLKTVDIRRAWPKEDKDFTPWVAQPEVLAELFAECEIDLGTDYELQTEKVLPGIKRKLDVFITAESGEKIAIENQFSVVDHDHLTRGLMYAVGLGAKTVIVIAECHRPEFVALAEYLNGAARAYEENGIALFLVEIEALTTDDSDTVFPQFNVVARPDEWRAAAFQAAHQPSLPTGKGAAIFDFHERVLPLVRQRTGIFKNVQPSVGSWKAGSFGISGVQIKYDVSKEKVVVQLWFHRPDPVENVAGLEYLRAREEDLRQLLHDHSLEWRVIGTALLEVTVDRLGWGTESTDSSFDEFLETISSMTTVAQTHRDGIREAINDARGS